MKENPGLVQRNFLDRNERKAGKGFGETICESVRIDKNLSATDAQIVSARLWLIT